MTVAEEQAEAKQPIDVKQAVRAAIRYVADLYEGQGVYDIMLEEVEHDATNWYVTVGLTRHVTQPKSRRTSLRDLALVETNPLIEREYKIVQVNATTGMPVSMKIRAV
jgi:hypothetical protein